MESECKALRNEAPKHSINQVISNNINLRSNTGQLQDESYNSSINQEKHYNQMQPGMGPPYNQMQSGMGPQVTTAGTSDPSKNKLLALLAQNSMNAYLAYSANE